MNLFTYGTLMDAAIMRKICADEFESQAATLSDFLRKKLAGEVYPGIVAHAGASVQGRVYFDVTAQALDHLDEFEGSYYQRQDVTLKLDGGEQISAQSYVLTAKSAALLSQEDWSLDVFMQRDKYLFEDKYVDDE